MIVKLVAPYTVEGINNASQLELMGFIRKAKGYLTLDTETASKGKSSRKIDPHDSKVVSIQIGDDATQYVVDTQYADLTYICLALEKKRVVAFNAKFDYSVILTNTGVRLQKLFDPMIASQLLTAGHEGLKHSLYEVCTRYLGHRPDVQPDLFMKSVVSKKVRTSYKEGEPMTLEQIVYGAKDVELTHLLYKKLSLLLKEEKLTKIAGLEFDFIKVAAECELNGMPLNTDKWVALIEDSERVTAELLNQLLDIADINWNSPKQVGEVFKASGIDISYVDKDSGDSKESVSRARLAPKAKDNELLTLYLEYKQYQKLKSSYGEKFLSHLSPITGRIHSDVLQLKVTGRTGSSNPSIQQIPKADAYRNCFESEDYLIGCDYSTQEICMVAHLSREPAMCEALSRGVDIHSWMASQIFSEEITPSLRQKAKTITFALLYGAGASKVAENLKIPIKEAKVIVARYFKAFPSLKAYLEKIQAKSLSRGYHTVGEGYVRKIRIPSFGRILALRELQAKYENWGKGFPQKYSSELSYLESKIRRDANNYPVQGSCATMSKLAGVYLYDYLYEKGFDKFKILCLIHDEWLIEAKDPAMSEVLQNCMLRAAEDTCSTVKIKAVAQVSKMWKK